MTNLVVDELHMLLELDDLAAADLADLLGPGVGQLVHAQLRFGDKPFVAYITNVALCFRVEVVDVLL